MSRVFASSASAGAGSAGPGSAGDQVAGIDFGGTKIRVVLCAPDGAVLDREVTPAPALEGGEAMTDAALAALARLTARAARPPIAIGLGAAGVVDRDAGRVTVASDSFAGWAGYPLVARIRERTGLPTVLENDVNAFLLGEAAAGAVVGEPDVVAVALGTGVGGALLLDGRLRLGPHGAAGEIGHIPGFGDRLCTCGRHGHLETLASGRSIPLRYREEAGDTLTPSLDAATDSAAVAALAADGDPVARHVFAEAGRGLARALTQVAGLLDVTVAVIGGGVTASWALIEPALRETLVAEPPVGGIPIDLRLSALGADAVAAGAASLARALVDVGAVADADPARAESRAAVAG